jgi:HK97 family phage major capsid protein
MASMQTLERLDTLTHDQLTRGRLIAWAQFLSEEYSARGGPYEAQKNFEARHPRSLIRDQLLMKAAVAAGTTTDATSMGPLAVAQPYNDYVPFMRAATILGRLPRLREVPFNISVPAQTTGGTYSWAGQNVPKLVTSVAFSTQTLAIAKVAGIVVVTDELARLSQPKAETVLNNELITGQAAFVDAQFTDPAIAAVANVSPASITNGVTPIAPTGTTQAAVAKDVAALIAQFLTNNNGENMALIMRPQEAILLAAATNSPTLTATGGRYAGIDVVVSAATGTRIIAVDQSAILYADGGVAIDVSRQAIVQLDTAPDNPTIASSVMTSLWQSDLAGFRIDRFVNWKRTRTTAVSMVSPTAYVPGT